MASLNFVHLIGNVGKDPEVRQFEGGGQLCTFTLATTERFTDRNGLQQENTEWHNIVLNGKLAGLSQFIHKGSTLYIGGKIHTRSWSDQQGNKRYQTEIVGQTVQLLDGRPQNQQQAAPVQAPAPAPAFQPNTAPAPGYAPQPQYPSAPAPQMPPAQPQYPAQTQYQPAPKAPQYQPGHADQDLPF